MSSKVQTASLTKLGEDDRIVWITKNTFVCVQSIPEESPKASLRHRCFTDTHCDYKPQALVRLSLCETEEGSNGESESDTESRNSDGGKYADMRTSNKSGNDCVSSTLMGNQQSMTQGSAKQQHPEEAPTMQPEDYTTVMLRNLPNNYTREMLVELLESKGFRQRFDFLYVPVDFAKCAGLGYAFVNFVSSEDGSRAMRVLESFDDWKVPSQKVLRLSWSLPLQGLASNIERYRNSAVMHPDVPEHFKPMVFENGCMVSFPAPTRNIALGVRSKAGRTYVYGAAPPEQSRTREEHEKPKARKVHQRLAVSPESHEEDHSTVMLRNLPNDYSRDMLVELLECTGFKKRFDFLYLPIDFEKGSGLGYAFVNFVDHRDALDAMKTLASFDDWKVPSSKRLELSWSIPLQGLSANVERYRNNSVMHPNVPERYKPLVLKDGQPAPFPAPTRNIHPPHRRR